MSPTTLKTALEAVALPDTNRTVGSEKALVSLTEEAGCLKAVLRFAYPVAWAKEAITTALHEAARAAGETRPLEIDIHTDILTRQVQQGVKTIAGVKNIIAVASGKGGVGKSTTAANLAVALTQMGARVGVLDADLYGPSQPAMLGVAQEKPQQENNHFIPVRNPQGIQVMSIGFLIEADQAVVWRGPMVSQALQQLLFQSAWDEVDYLLVDLPPGTGDIQLTLSQRIPVTGAVIVTTPQDIALLDARKAVDMFHKVNIPILGLLENMSVHVCSHCGHAEAIFGRDGGKQLALAMDVPLLGQLPLSLPIRQAMDTGAGAALQAAEPEIAALYRHAAWQLVLALADKGKDYSSRFPNIVVE